MLIDSASTSIRDFSSNLVQKTGSGAGAASSGDAKVMTIGKDPGSREVSERLLSIVGDMRDEGEDDDGIVDINDHMMMYTYTNSGTSPEVNKELIPGFALNFL